MFLKQYNYKPRSGSQGSQDGGQQQAQQATQQPAQQQASSQGGAVSDAIAGRRRSSAGQFAGLQGYKRSSGEINRESFHEQSQQSGVLGQMWTNFTKK